MVNKYKIFQKLLKLRQNKLFIGSVQEAKDFMQEFINKYFSKYLAYL